MGDSNDFDKDELFNNSLSQPNNKEISEQPVIYETSSGKKIIRAKKSNLPDIQKEKAEKKSLAPAVLYAVLIIIAVIIMLLFFGGKEEKTKNNNGGVSISAPENEIPTLVTTSENGELSVHSVETDIVEIQGNTYTFNGRTYSIQKDIDGNVMGILNSEGKDISVKNENGIIESIKNEDGNAYKVIITESNTGDIKNGDNQTPNFMVSIDYTKTIDDDNENSGESNNGNTGSSIEIGVPSIDKPVTATTSVNSPELGDKPTAEVPTIGNILIETPGIVGTPSIVTPQIEMSTVYMPTK